MIEFLKNKFKQCLRHFHTAVLKCPQESIVMIIIVCIFLKFSLFLRNLYLRFCITQRSHILFILPSSACCDVMPNAETTETTTMRLTKTSSSWTPSTTTTAFAGLVSSHVTPARSHTRIDDLCYSEVNAFTLTGLKSKRWRMGMGNKSRHQACIYIPSSSAAFEYKDWKVKKLVRYVCGRMWRDREGGQVFRYEFQLPRSRN
jgi:hypothetical protein